jgi:hypothetical protein
MDEGIAANEEFTQTPTRSPQSKIRDLEELMIDIESNICGKQVELRQLEEEHRGIRTVINNLHHPETETLTGW